MTIQEAREILGVGPHEDPRPLMDGLRAERENLAAMVRDAPNAILAMRHQDALVRFDQALATVRETMDILGLPAPHPPAESVAEPEESTTAPAEAVSPPPRKSSLARIAAALMMLAIAGSGMAGWLYWQDELEKQAGFEAEFGKLLATGNAHVENRRWDDARLVFAKIRILAPDRPDARIGLARIEAGIAEEQSQFIGYWTGEAQAALDSGRWDDAEAAARNVLERFPEQPDALSVIEDIAGAKLAEARREAIARTTGLLDRGEPDAALEAATTLAHQHQGDEEIAALLARATQAVEQRLADLARAQQLFENARARDTGVFDEQALEWLREAALLAPQDQTIAAHLEKMSSYTRTIRVPEDVADLEEALANARENDRILLGPGTWQGAFVINLPIELQGAGPEETILECPAIAGCAITIGPEAIGARVTGIAFRHDGFDPGADRYSAALVRGGSVIFADCHFHQASGHGLAIIEGGRAELQRCQLRSNGWNGIAATGEGSKAIANESLITGNFGHGVEGWDGAQISITRCRIEGNTGNGVHLDSSAGDNLVESCELIGNREYGIVLTAAGSGRVAKNRILQNQLGGAAIRHAAKGILVGENEILGNSGPGLLLDQGLDPSSFRNNKVQRNSGSQILSQARLTPATEGE